MSKEEEREEGEKSKVQQQPLAATSSTPRDMFHHDNTSFEQRSLPGPTHYNQNHAMDTIIINGHVYKICGQVQSMSPMSSKPTLPQSSPPMEEILLHQQQVDLIPLPSPIVPTGVGVGKRSSTGTKPQHMCSVCGDRAFYVFYGALACDSCRTFFRRQVLQCKTLICHFKGECKVQLNTRKDCAKCRLDKCLRVGMKNCLVAVNEVIESGNGHNSCTDADSSNNQSSKVEATTDDNPPKDITLKSIDRINSTKSGSYSSPASPISQQTSDISNQKEDNQLLTSSNQLYRSTSDQDHRVLSNSSVVYRSKKHLALMSNCKAEVKQGKGDDAEQPTNKNLNNSSSHRPSLVAKKTQMRSNRFSISMRSHIDGSTKNVIISNLHLTEQEKLQELMTAVLKLESKGERDQNSNEEPFVFSLCNVIYLATTRLVSAINSLKSFDYLPHSDQLILLKGSISEMIFLWSVRAFDVDSKSWKLNCFKNNIISHSPELRLPMDVLKAAKHNDLSLFHEYEKFVDDFDRNLGKDELLINILIAICVFNPNRDDLVEKDHVRCERNLYRSLLKKYLDSIMESNESAIAFSKLTTKIDDLTALKDIYESSEVDPDDINQLVRTTKLLDIKNTMHHDKKFDG